MPRHPQKETLEFKKSVSRCIHEINTQCCPFIWKPCTITVVKLDKQRLGNGYYRYFLDLCNPQYSYILDTVDLGPVRKVVHNLSQFPVLLHYKRYQAAVTFLEPYLVEDVIRYVLKDYILSP
jgi:hypothetical protein